LSRAAGLERFAALRAGLRRKERIFSLLPRHLPFGSQARLGTVPGYYQSSRCAGLGLHASNGVESHPLQKRQRMGTTLLSGKVKSGMVGPIRPDNSYAAVAVFLGLGTGT